MAAKALLWPLLLRAAWRRVAIAIASHAISPRRQSRRCDVSDANIRNSYDESIAGLWHRLPPMRSCSAPSTGLFVAVDLDFVLAKDGGALADGPLRAVVPR